MTAGKVVRIASIGLPGVTIAVVAFVLLRPGPPPVTAADRMERPPPTSSSARL